MHLDKGKVRQSFAAASTTYDAVAELQRAVGKTLLDRIVDDNPAGTLLDIGCGTGFLTSGLLVHGMPVIALDIALPMLQVTKNKLAGASDVGYICADAEQLPLVEQSIDRVFSNLALQWCVNLDAVFADLKRVLKPSGKLTFSTFGPKTLQELKAAWAEVDDYHHVNDFYSEGQVADFLKQAGFTAITTETYHYVPTYASVWDLMRELKHIGAHNVMAERNRNMTSKARMQRMIAAYQQGSGGSGIPATFEVIMVQAS